METSTVSSYISRRRAKDKRFDEAFVGESERLEVAVALRTLRETEGLTQRQLAEKVEKPQSTIARIENGNMNVTFKTMNDIAKAFDKVIEVKFVQKTSLTIILFSMIVRDVFYLEQVIKIFPMRYT